MNILLALTNMNGHEPIKIPEFWKKLAKDLLNNTFQLSDTVKNKIERVKAFVDIELMSLPEGKRYHCANGDI